jgi:hypothetical protein
VAGIQARLAGYGLGHFAGNIGIRVVGHHADHHATAADDRAGTNPVVPEHTGAVLVAGIVGDGDNPRVITSRSVAFIGRVLLARPGSARSRL